MEDFHHATPFGLRPVSCSSSDSPAAAPTAPTLTPLPTVQGRWQGSITSPADGTGTITADLIQSGSAVTGSVVLSQPGLPDVPGTFTGTLESAAGLVTLRYTTFYDYHDGCTGTYGGTLDVSGGVLSGTYIRSELRAPVHWQHARREEPVANARLLVRHVHLPVGADLDEVPVLGG